MITMEIWETIRLRCRRDGEKIKPVARDLGIAPNTLRKYLRQDTPPKFTAQPRPKLLDRYVKHIDELLRSTPKITAVRVGSYLRQNIDAELVVDQRTLRKYVAARRAILVPREAFVRAAYAPGAHYVERRVMLRMAEEPGSGADPSPFFATVFST